MTVCVCVWYHAGIQFSWLQALYPQKHLHYVDMRKPGLLAIVLSVQIWSLGPRGLFKVKRGIADCVQTATWCHSARQMSTMSWHAFWSYQPIFLHWAVTSPSNSSFANSSLGCSCLGFATKQFCGNLGFPWFSLSGHILFVSLHLWLYGLSYRNTTKKAMKEISYHFQPVRNLGTHF